MIHTHNKAANALFMIMFRVLSPVLLLRLKVFRRSFTGGRVWYSLVRQSLWFPDRVARSCSHFVVIVAFFFIEWASKYCVKNL